jgi:hypothetical protein
MKKDEQKYPPQIKILDIATIVSSILILIIMFYVAFVLIRPTDPTMTLIILGVGILVVIADLAAYFGFIRKKMIEKYAKF